MTQENKELLIRDLSARLPYGVKVQFEGWDEEIEDYVDIVDTLYSVNLDKWVNVSETDNEIIIEGIKPYLFPMSSMTKEQKKEYYNLCIEEEREQIEFGEWITRVYYHNTIESIDWLNKNHFDYRGLIEKGLAIDSTGKNIY